MKKINKEVVYEDDEIICILKSGKSNFLFITFGDSISLADGLKIYAEPVSDKLGYSTLGFMAKKRNWYPKESMQKAVLACHDFLLGYESRILYGGSMGGYAAIKYSSLINANHVITCCPQWSIDPSECDGNKNGYEKYYNQEMNGMGVIPSDVAGDVYVIYDPKHKVDSFHYSRLDKLQKNIKAVPAPYVRHHATSVIAGSKNISDMVNAAISCDPEMMRRIVCNIRRKSSVRQDNLIRTSAVRHPSLTLKIIASLAIKSEGAIDAINVIVSNFLKRKKYEEIVKAVEVLKLDNKGNDVYEYLIENANLYLNKRYIESFHGYKIIYDFLSNGLRQKESNDLLFNFGLSCFVYIMSFNNIHILAIDVKGKPYPLYTNGSMFLLGDEIKPNMCPDKYIEAIFYNEDEIVITNDIFYLSALNTGQVTLNRKGIKDWERFKLV